MGPIWACTGSPATCAWVVRAVMPIQRRRLLRVPRPPVGAPIEREHQRPAAPVLPQADRPVGAYTSGSPRRRAARQRPAPQDARLAHSPPGVRRRPTLALTTRCDDRANPPAGPSGSRRGAVSTPVAESRTDVQALAVASRHCHRVETTSIQRGLGTPFRVLFTASTGSNLGDGVLVAAVPLLARRLSDDPRAVSSVTVVATLPWLLFGLAAGAIVDRADRRRAMVRADLMRCAGLVLTGK